ncbi:hypothetical protein Gotri_002327, partial [Gossypium trilobum]|nr:hypothetical protein [Gossypium trilobum]
VTKKVRRWPDLLSNTDDPTVEENGRKLSEAVMAKVSYKNTLIRSSTTSDSPQNVEDFELQEGDVTTEMENGNDNHCQAFRTEDCFQCFVEQDHDVMEFQASFSTHGFGK